MSAMTAPIGRRRTSAAICSGVGTRVDPRIKSGGGDKGRGGGFGGPGGGSRGRRSAVGGSAWRRGLGVQPGGCADDPGFERLGTEEAAGDAREDQSDVAGAERVLVVAERGGELSAVIDELADEADEPAGTAGLWGVGGGGLSAGHEQTRNTERRSVSRNLFPVVHSAKPAKNGRQLYQVPLTTTHTGIHVFAARGKKDVDVGAKPRHDGIAMVSLQRFRAF